MRGARGYYLYNAHGDVVSFAGRFYKYDAFGNELTTNANDDNPFRYAGEYFDAETESYYLRARYYDPATGRFSSEDPVRDGLNYYTYGNGNPVLFVDPMGLSALRNDEMIDIATYALKHPETIKFVVLQGGAAAAAATAALGGGTAALTAGGLVLAAGAVVFVGGYWFMNVADYMIEITMNAMPYRLLPPFKLVSETTDYITYYDVNGIRHEELKGDLDKKFNTRRYAPNPKHGRIDRRVNGRIESANPFYGDEQSGLSMLITAYEVDGEKQLYNYWKDYRMFVAFQPDNTGGYHPYRVDPGKVPPSVLNQMFDDGLLTKPEWKKYRRGKTK